jgi:hypothetical protein
MTDARSPLAVKIIRAYPDAYEALVVDGGTPARAHELLDGVQPEQLLAAPAALPSAGDCMLAGLWLWHDGLEKSHTLSQSIHSATGSFWHAILHRREGDFSNSKYWYARVSGHPALPTIAAQASDVLGQEPADKSLLRLIVNGWNPNAFVDLVESVYNDASDARRSLVVRLQQLEWNVLFDFCARQ